MLQGPRVTLRAARREDMILVHHYNTDVEVELAGGGDPPLPQSIERLLADFDNEITKGGRNGTNFIIDADDHCIGFCALFGFDDSARTAALGITIGDKEYWGKGYGREAITLLVDYAFRLRNLRRIWLTVNGRNERAIRAYTACGFVEEGRLREHVWNNGAYDDLVYMAVTRAEHTQAPSR
jgi:RimJ/RimL family protein N-acetyltransferase